jgi:hypothetical protein
MSDDLEARVRALEIMVRSFMIQTASQWGNDAPAALDQWQAEIVKHHPDDEAALTELFDDAIRRFG